MENGSKEEKTAMESQMVHNLCGLHILFGNSKNYTNKMKNPLFSATTVICFTIFCQNHAEILGTFMSLLPSSGKKNNILEEFF